MAKITYADKVAIEEQSAIAEVNKITAENMNEIKEVVNELDDTAVKTFSGNTVPSDDLGKDGDIYILTDQRGEINGKKFLSQWNWHS